MAEALLADFAAGIDYTTIPFKTIEELNHGDAVLGSFLMGMAEHWAIFDAFHNVFIELSRVDGKAMVVARPSEEWMDRWKKGNPCKVNWKHQPAHGGDVVRRARSKIGPLVGMKYALLARSNDPSHMNCEAFARWCQRKMSRSTQAEKYVSYAPFVVSISIATILFVLGW